MPPAVSNFQYTADETGGLWESRDSDTGKDTFTRDVVGNLVKSTSSFGGNQIQSLFDAVNRTTRTVIKDPKTGADLAIFNYAYDRNPDGSGPAPIGRLTQISGSFGSVQFFYDKLGNILKKVQSHGQTKLTDLYEYDQLGRLHTVTYPSGRQVHVKLDALSRPTTMYTRATSTDEWSLVADQVSYTPFSDPKRMRLGGKFVATRTRDTAGRVTSYHDGQGIVNVQRRKDGLIQKLSSGGQPLAAYAYDSSNHLKAASGEGFGAQQYTYESTGDLAALYGVSLEYQDNTSKLTSFGGAEVRYGQRGLIQKAGTLSLTYNALGLVASTKLGDNPVVRYTYDALGQRQSKTRDGGPTINYHYDLAGRLIGEFDPSTGQVLREYIWLGQRPLMMIVPKNDNQPEARYFIYTDYSDTPIRLVDQGGNTVWRWQRDPFGTNVPQIQKITFNLRMPGQYYDAESGLHYNGARYYAPVAGRYLQPDPMGEAAGISAYTYASGDPVNAIDPTGLEPIDLGTWPTITVTATPSSSSFDIRAGGTRLDPFTQATPFIGTGMVTDTSNISINRPFASGRAEPVALFENLIGLGSLLRWGIGALVGRSAQGAAVSATAAASAKSEFIAIPGFVGHRITMNGTSFSSKINGGCGAINNCMNTAFAVERSLAGFPTSAVPYMVGSHGPNFKLTGSLSGLMTAVGKEAPGTHVYVITEGHIFNAFRAKAGHVVLIDGQPNAVFTAANQYEFVYGTGRHFHGFRDIPVLAPKGFVP